MKSPRKSALILFLFVLAAVLGMASFALRVLPKILTHRINGRLRAVSGYDGGVERVRLKWAKPRLILHQFHLNKRDATPPGVFLSADQISIGFSWSALLRGNLVLDVTLEKPRIVCLMRQRGIGEPLKYGLWQEFFAPRVPFRMDRVTINDGILRFQNDQSIPPIDVTFDEVTLTADNLANRESMVLPKTTLIKGCGRLMDHAPVRLSVEMEPFKKHSTFRLKGEVKDFNLVFLNEVLRHYTGLELKKGSLTMGGEFTVRDGEFNGRVHRRIEGLIVRSRHRGFINGMKEIYFQAWIDRREDTITGRIENDFRLSGPLGYMDQDAFLAAVWVAKSAFLQSLRARMTGEIRMGTPEEAQDKWAAQQAREREKRAREKRRHGMTALNDL